MPRPLHLSRSGARRVAASCTLACLCAAQIAAAQGGCTDALTVRPGAEERIEVTLASPCYPYTSVIVGYGPFSVIEETSDTGALRVTFPALPEARSVTLNFGDRELASAVPPLATPPGGFVAIEWQGPAGFVPEFAGIAPLAEWRLGFPADTATPHLEVYIYGPEAPLGTALDLRLSPEHCGRTVSARLMTSDAPQPRDLRIDVPRCGPAGMKLRLPLVGS